jgi:hypothetical protein
LIGQHFVENVRARFVESGDLTLFGSSTRPARELTLDDVPAGWLEAFPSGAELAHMACARRPIVARDVDRAFMARHAYEYQLFQLVEAAYVLPRVTAGFPTVPQFLGLAQSVLQRRKSRAGRSLELHLEAIFRSTGVAYESQPETEPGHRPDFVFPGMVEYRSALPGDPRLAMLAAKSTLRDRWRQVLREADKIPIKHLFTLDEGISERQFRDISNAGLVVVAPRQRLGHYPETVRRHLVSIRQFIDSRLAIQAGS